MNKRKFKAGDKVKILYQYPFVEECFNKGKIGTVLNWMPYGSSTTYAVEGDSGKWMDFDESDLELVEEKQ